MTSGFVVSVSDFAALTSRLHEVWTGDVILCSSVAELPLLAQTETVYFVVSQVSMISTAFQQLVLESLSLVEESRRKVFRMDAATIPVGFKVLQSLPGASI